MVLVCPKCSARWKPIVKYCPKCGVNFRLTTNGPGDTEQKAANQTKKNSNFLKNSAVWSLMIVIGFGALFAVNRTGDQISSTESSQSSQGSSSNQGNSSGSTQQDDDRNITQSSESEPDNGSTEGDGVEQDSGTDASTKNFSKPKEKPSVTLISWLEKNSVYEALIAIQKWSATYRTINPTQIDEATAELEDALSGIVDASDYIESKGYPRVEQYDQRQQELMDEVEAFIRTTASLWIQVNNERGSREAVVELLEGKISALADVDVEVKSLLIWLKDNGTKYETR